MTIFKKIIDGEISTDFIYQDDDVVAFRDIDPKAPVHVLIVPRKEITTINDIAAEDKPLIGHMLSVAAQIAKQEGIADSGYRAMFNCNEDGGQTVFHIHLHLLGGKPLGPMIAS
ncbi:MAG: histidine triad nucleotide-binding protein [Gammaproteobacteria bacterium]|nr:histidine triad nucleotide-binding protein [Gammaproteobacteria bacterium]